MTTRPEIRVTDATAAALPFLAELEALCFSRPAPLEVLRGQLGSDRHLLLAAWADDALAGYAGLMHVLDEGYIMNVAVAPACRRLGVGTVLLDALKARARDLALSFLTLEVRVSNAAARALYESCGFVEVGRRPDYYEKPVEDALLLTTFL